MEGKGERQECVTSTLSLSHSLSHSPHNETCISARALAAASHTAQPAAGSHWPPAAASHTLSRRFQGQPIGVAPVTSLTQDYALA